MTAEEFAPHKSSTMAEFESGAIAAEVCSDRDMAKVAGASELKVTKISKHALKKQEVKENADSVGIDVFTRRSDKLTPENIPRIIRQLGYIPYNLIHVAAFSREDPTEPWVLQLYPMNTNDLNGRYSKLVGHQLPFPTMFWMSSRELQARVAEIEVAGWVVELEKRLRSSEEYLSQMERAHRSYAAERWALLSEEELKTVSDNDWVGPLRDKGVAGIRDFTTVKCLHCHYSHFLARPEHGNIVGQWVDELLAQRDAGKTLAELV